MCVKELMRMTEELNRVLQELNALIEPIDSVKAEHHWSYKPAGAFAGVDHVDYEIELSGAGGPKVVSGARLTIHVVDCCSQDSDRMAKVAETLGQARVILRDGP